MSDCDECSYVRCEGACVRLLLYTCSRLPGACASMTRTRYCVAAYHLCMSAPRVTRVPFHVHAVVFFRTTTLTAQFTIAHTS